jgi:hypothetical protein
MSATMKRFKVDSPFLLVLMLQLRLKKASGESRGWVQVPYITAETVTHKDSALPHGFFSGCGICFLLGGDHPQAFHFSEGVEGNSNDHGAVFEFAANVDAVELGILSR